MWHCRKIEADVRSTLENTTRYRKSKQKEKYDKDTKADVYITTLRC